jgi:hypothetical protein
VREPETLKKLQVGHHPDVPSGRSDGNSAYFRRPSCCSLIHKRPRFRGRRRVAPTSNTDGAVACCLKARAPIPIIQSPIFPALEIRFSPLGRQFGKDTAGLLLIPRRDVVSVYTKCLSGPSRPYPREPISSRLRHLASSLIVLPNSKGARSEQW